jgi:hypothetical protein
VWLAQVGQYFNESPDMYSKNKAFLFSYIMFFLCKFPFLFEIQKVL